MGALAVLGSTVDIEQRRKIRRVADVQLPAIQNDSAKFNLFTARMLNHIILYGSFYFLLANSFQSSDLAMAPGLVSSAFWLTLPLAAAAIAICALIQTERGTTKAFVGLLALLYGFSLTCQSVHQLMPAMLLVNSLLLTHFAAYTLAYGKSFAQNPLLGVDPGANQTGSR